MPSVRSESSGYKYWVAAIDLQAADPIRLERIQVGQWQCDRCLAVLDEIPPQTFEQRATLHVDGHRGSNP